VTDEDFVLNCHTFTDERVTGNLAALPDPRPFLNFHEGSDFRFVTDLTTVKIYEGEYTNAFPQLDVRRNELVGLN
jgi:hypothetical protein